MTPQTTTTMTMKPTNSFDVPSYLEELCGTIQKLPLQSIHDLTRLLLKAYDSRRTVFLFGNGGSASLASHMACDLGKGAAPPTGRRLRVVALTDNVALITAWANDTRYEDIFAEQLENLLQPGDVALAISGSGNSPNILAALSFARRAGAITAGIAGFQGGRMKPLCDLCVVVPSDNMQIIEDLHLSIAHSVFRVLRHEIEVANQTGAARVFASPLPDPSSPSLPGPGQRIQAAPAG